MIKNRSHPFTFLVSQHQWLLWLTDVFYSTIIPPVSTVNRIPGTLLWDDLSLLPQVFPSPERLPCSMNRRPLTCTTFPSMVACSSRSLCCLWILTCEALCKNLSRKEIRRRKCLSPGVELGFETFVVIALHLEIDPTEVRVFTRVWIGYE